MTDLIVRYIHFIGIMGLTASLVGAHLLISKEVRLEQFRKLVITDMVYGISAVMVLISGLALWLWVGKPADFYSTNWILHLKLTLFVLVFLISLYPTRFFLKNRKSKEDVIVMPKSIIMIIRMELLFVFILPFLGVLLASGQ